MFDDKKMFFSEDGVGLTSTSANNIANMAKESYESIDSFLKDITFCDETLKLLDGSGEPFVMKNGIKSEDLAAYSDMIEKKASYQALIAWLREALSAKDQIISEINSMDDATVSKIIGIEIPEIPSMDKSLTEEDYKASLTVKERNEFFMCETYASAFGKLIHGCGEFKKARTEFFKHLKTPNTIEGKGKDTVIRSYIPSVTENEVEDTFFKLQEKHREYESRLNGYKHKMKTAIEKSYDEAYSKYRLEMDIWRAENENVKREIGKWKENEVRKARDLKIIIPVHLQSVFEEVSSRITVKKKIQ